MARFIEVAYSINGTFGYNEEADETIRGFAGEAGLDETGCGSGVGMRDISFDSEDEGAIDDFMSKKDELIADLKALGLSDISVEAIAYED